MPVIGQYQDYMRWKWQEAMGSRVMGEGEKLVHFLRVVEKVIAANPGGRMRWALNPVKINFVEQLLNEEWKARSQEIRANELVGSFRTFLKRLKKEEEVLQFRKTAAKKATTMVANIWGMDPRDQKRMRRNPMGWVPKMKGPWPGEPEVTKLLRCEEQPAPPHRE